MSYVNVYSSRINWEHEPSITSPINATNLNKMDYALHEMDGTFANWDTTKANESDMLLAIKSVDYDTETGVFLFTWFNGTTKTVDLNIEKIPVSFSMSAQGVITMKTEDGTEYTADVGSLIKTYTFTDSSEIDFTVTTDASGNKTVTASLVAGSIDGTKLTPNYLADCTAAKTGAENAADAADDSAEDAEAWAVGQRNGTDVPSTDPTYHNNAKYWSEQSNPTTLTGLTDTDINNPTNGQGLIYNSTSQKWENGAGGGSVATLSDVNLTDISDGQILKYNSSSQKWKNKTLKLSDITDVASGGAVDGSYLGYSELYSRWEAIELAVASNSALGLVKVGEGLLEPSFVRTQADIVLPRGDSGIIPSKSVTFMYPRAFTDFGYVKVYTTKYNTHSYPAKIDSIVVTTNAGSYTYTYSPSVTEVLLDSTTITTDIPGSTSWDSILVNYTPSQITYMDVNFLTVESYRRSDTTDTLSTLDRWSTAVSCSVGATTATFTDVTYSSSWTYDVYADDGTGEPIAISKIEVNASNQVIVTFASALVNATSVKLHYWG